MNLFDHKKRNRFEGSHLIGLMLITVGMIVGILSVFVHFNPPFSNMLPLTVCLVSIGLIMLFTYSGTEINLTKNEFRDYFCCCGIKLGEWTSLPPISKVKVKSSTQKTSNIANGISPTLSGKVTDHRVILYANQPTPLLSFSYKKREASLKHADILAINLKTEVVIE